MLITFDDLDELMKQYTAAVAIARYRDNRWLLGLSTSQDDRKGKWTFPGGGIKRKECPFKAAERECWEETGIKVKALGNPNSVLKRKEKPHVLFIPCRITTKPNFKPNSEFSALGLFSEKDLKSLVLYENVKSLIKSASQYY